MTDHESARLSDEERRILAEIEQGLDSHRPRRLGLFRRRAHRSPRPAGRRRGMWWTGVVLGCGLLAGGLLAGAVWVAAAGFIAVLVSFCALTANVAPARLLQRLRLVSRHGGDAAPGEDR